ncbi:MAG: VIT1/CCC1 transporter family protein [Candidatus Lokiarchaeota archaeon]
MKLNDEEHIEGGGKIRSFILGFNDGLISTFTLLVGVAAATIIATGGNTFVILTGIAAMVSGSVSMGLGEYISSKSEAAYIKNEIEREEAEIKLFPNEEKEEVREIFKDMSFEGDLLEKSVEKIVSNKKIWIDFLTKSELGLEEPGNPIIGALITFLAFVFGNSISLFPYFFNFGMFSLVLSSIISFSMLFIAGVLKTRITGEKPWKGGLEMVLIGVVAFIISYTVGLFLEP